LTGQDDIVIGTDIANRNQIETDGVIGFFVNQLVLRTDLAGNPSFREILGRVRTVVLEAYAHQELPFDRLIDVLKPERDLSRTSLFQVKFVLQNAPTRRPTIPHLTMSAIHLEHRATKFDLLLNMSNNNDGILGWLEYNTDIFEKETIIRMIDRFKYTLEQIVVDPDARLSKIESILADIDKENQYIAHKQIEQMNIDKINQIKRNRNTQGGRQ
jgi:non-ribosomal peptide synthetase component F